MEYKASVLIVEDTEDWQNIFREILTSRDYRVEVASSYVEAKQFLSRLAFDMAIVDIRLSGDKSNTDGMKVLAEIRDTQDPTSKIIVSGNATVKLARDALVEFEALDIIEKDTFDEEKFINLIERGVQKAQVVRSGNRLLKKTLAIENKLTLEEISLLPGSPQDREELLQKMLVDLQPLSKSPQSTSRPIETWKQELMVQITGWSKKVGEVIVARIGPRNVITKESRNYSDHKLDLIINTSKKRPFYKPGLGGLIYILKGAQPENPVQDFLSFYTKKEDASQIIDAIKNLFSRSCIKLYLNRGIDKVKVDLSPVYKPVIDRIAAERKRELLDGEEHYLRQLEEEDRESYLRARHHQNSIGFDPIEFLRRKSFIFESAVGVVHGDLRDGNIIVDSLGAQTWLLGFYNTGLSDVRLTRDDKGDGVAMRAHQAGKRNLLHDFATLEVSIRETLINVNPEEILLFDLALCRPKEYGEFPSSQTTFSNPQVDKAYKVITGLRGLVCEIVVDFEGDMQLYYAELMFQFLENYLRLPNQIVRERIWTSAVTLAERLGQWH